jgi:hypothetical protein
VSNKNSAPTRGWLPSLTAGQRFRSEPGSGETLVSDAAILIAEPEAEEVPPMPDTDRNRNHLLVQDWSSALETQFGLTAPETETGSESESESDSEPEETVASLKDRLAYYEHFDALIKDNISRSAALFQEVFAERENARTVQGEAESTIKAVASEAERRAEAERTHVQHILMSLMDEATDLHQRSDALIQRLAEALTEIAPQSNEDDEPVSGA